MILGTVNANHEATIRLIVRGLQGDEKEIEAIIDTGFTGFLTLPAALTASLGLTWRGHAQAVLADGGLHLFNVYAAIVIVDGQPQTVETDEADAGPLVGMGLIYGHDLRIQAVDGGAVVIAALP